MVNFSKQLETQLIPEWKEAFVDYSKLKKKLKNINNHLNIYNNNKIPTKDCFSANALKLTSFVFRRKHQENEAIQVHKKLASSASNDEDVYETELLDRFANTDAAREFFTCLDIQLNKVNKFYKKKEREFMDRGDCLHKQMEILIELKTALKEQTLKGTFAVDSKEDASISCTISCDTSVKDRTEQQDSISTDDSENNEVKSENDDEKSRTISGGVFGSQRKNLKIKIPLTTPSRTFSAIGYLFKQDFVNQYSKNFNPDGKRVAINKTELQHAEKIIKGAFIELYKGLGYLKTYRNLNMLAFIKIMKKFDKVTEKQVRPIYIKVVESSYFNSSDEVTNLSDQVEDLFVKQFAQQNRTKGLSYLKTHHRKDSHAVTFFIGLSAGCFIALFVGYVVMARITGIYTQIPDTLYMETIYPIISMFSLLFLHLFLYGCNIFMWRKTRINYSFIFELEPSKELKYRDVFLICTASMSAVFGTMFLHLLLLAQGYSYAQVQSIPSLLLLTSLLLLVCPFDIFYRSSRYHFLRILRNIVFSPLYKVVMLDFFMADQLCSQVPMLRNLEYVACYYGTGSFKTQDYDHCIRTKRYKDLAYIVSFLPYYWRAMQCARRWFDEGEKTHLMNLGKYVSAMLAAGAKVVHEKEKSVGSLCVVVIMSSFATIYQLYWDFVKDWGLLQMSSKNPWLRNELMLRRKIIYYISMGLNLVLRLAWLRTVLHSNFEHVDYRLTDLFLASLEVIRRAQWNFYRLENEHLNNAGKFRAVKIVPLPFHEVDEED